MCALLGEPFFGFEKETTRSESPKQDLPFPLAVQQLLRALRPSTEAAGPRSECGGADAPWRLDPIFPFREKKDGRAVDLPAEK